MKPQAYPGRLLMLGVALWSLAFSAAAWAPQTRAAMVNTAIHLVSRNANLPLRDLAEDVRAGALIPQELQNSLYPGYEADPVSAIEVEMQLLSAAGGRIDRYYAYRLGALGRLVADYVAPMRGGDPVYRNLYYADVDKHIGGIALELTAPRMVEPSAYFPERVRAAAANDTLIGRDYASGLGFSGVAAGLLAKDAMRAASAVVDVWHTVIASKALAASISEQQLQAYVLGAYQYYIDSGNIAELNPAAKRLDTLTPPTADMRTRLGDLLMAGGATESAIQAYQEALRLEPGRPDATEKIAAYYAKKGQDQLGEARLDDALSSFEKALEANPGQIEAETGRIQTVRGIEEREARLSADRAIMDQAANYEELAEAEATDGKYAEAIALLRQASSEYERVSPESVSEYQQSRDAINEIGVRVRDLKEGIVSNAQLYGGRGFELDRGADAVKATKGMDAQALEAYLQKAYEAQMAQLEARLAPALKYSAK